MLATINRQLGGPLQIDITTGNEAPSTSLQWGPSSRNKNKTAWHTLAPIQSNPLFRCNLALLGHCTSRRQMPDSSKPNCSWQKC